MLTLWWCPHAVVHWTAHPDHTRVWYVHEYVVGHGWGYTDDSFHSADNVNYPWVDNLPRTIPTIGQLLRSKGYYSAYHGKWHLSREVCRREAILPDPTVTHYSPLPAVLQLATHNQDALPASALRQAMEAYGFNDYSGIGDVMGKCRGAWLNDDMIGSQTIQWLKRHGLAQNEAGTPWFCAVNLVNPHDVMFFNTDKPGEPVQADPKPVMALAPAPVSSLYQQVRRMRSKHTPVHAVIDARVCVNHCASAEMGHETANHVGGTTGRERSTYGTQRVCGQHGSVDWRNPTGTPVAIPQTYGLLPQLHPALR